MCQYNVIYIYMHEHVLLPSADPEPPAKAPIFEDLWPQWCDCTVPWGARNLPPLLGWVNLCYWFKVPYPNSNFAAFWSRTPLLSTKILHWRNGILP